MTEYVMIICCHYSVEINRIPLLCGNHCWFVQIKSDVPLIRAKQDPIFFSFPLIGSYIIRIQLGLFWQTNTLGLMEAYKQDGILFIKELPDDLNMMCLLRRLF